MRPDRAKQLLKNGLYRTIGETATTIGAVDGDSDRALRVLMYHKVNDRPENPISVPIGLFDEQMAVLRELGYQVVSLDDVLDHVAGITPLPPGAVLITFDDGYRDILENALPVLRRHGYPAVIFVPIGYLDDARPLPHEEHLVGDGAASTRRSTGTSCRSSRPAGSASRATASATARSRTSTSTRRRGRSRSRS